MWKLSVIMKCNNSVIRQILASSIITLSVLMSGTFFGWWSPVSEMMKNDPPPVRLTEAETSWTVASIEFGNLLLPLPAGYMMDRIGRRWALATSAPIAIAGWALIRFTRHTWCLYAARVFQGCAMGIAYTVVPIYLGEIAGPKVRGTIGLFHQGMNSSGVLFVYIVGWMFSYDTLAVAMCAAPILLILLLKFVPESPHYLAMRGDTEGALVSLCKLQPTASLDELQNELRGMKIPPSSSTRDLLKTSGRELAIVLIMGVLQIFVGISALEAYASSAFANNGPETPAPNEFSTFSNNSDALQLAQPILDDAVPLLAQPNACAAMLAMVALSSDFLAATIIDRFGRWPLLLGSLIGSSVSHAAAAYGLYHGHQRLLVLVGLTGAMFCANAGIMPIVSISVCEYFPTHYRARANSILQLVITAASLVSLKIYQPISDLYGVYANYTLFSIVAAFGVVFVYLFIPETKGKTFGEIEELFRQNQNRSNSEYPTAATIENGQIQ